MAAQRGALFLLSIYDGVSAYDAIVQARSTEFTINSETVDVTNKGSAGWRALLEGAGIRSMSITLEGVFEDATHEATINTLAMNGNHELYEIASGTGDKWAGSFQITSYSRSGVYNGEEVFSVTLESVGAITYTAA